MQLKISHKTRYSFETPPVYGLQQLRLTPQSIFGQYVLNWSLDIDGATLQASYIDEHENKTHLIALDPDRDELVISSQGTIDMTDQNGIVGVHRGFTPLWLFLRETVLTEMGPLVGELSKVVASSSDVADFHSLSHQIVNQVAYQTGSTNSATTAEQAVALGQGVCQDHAHIFIAAARQSGHPARYVSGYLMMNDRVEQDATHAWAEVWIEGLGWTGFDVSNGISPDARYVRLATGLDYEQAAPISGLTIGGDGESMDIGVQVQQ